MRLAIALVLCVLATLEAAAVEKAASQPEKPLLPFSISGRPLFGFNGQHLLEQPASSSYEKYFTQTLNQLNKSDTRTFQQRYFVNTQWKSNKNGAVHILFIEGDGPASDVKVKDASYPHVALAKDVGATVWVLEHRFYGNSQPFKRSTIANLAYLSSQQAVRDIANFIDGQNKNSGDSNPKWVVFGSSYGGSLALWVRQKYPSRTVGAVSDSAAVQPTIDFWSYERTVEQAYANYSYECWHGIKFSALAVRNEIQYEEGVDRMNVQLNLKPKIDDYRVDYKDYQHLHHNILTLFEIPVIYNNVNLGPFANSSMAQACKIMTNETGGSNGDAERVFQLAKQIYQNSDGSFVGINNDYKSIVSYLGNTVFNSSDLVQASARSWFWQQCNEFGQFITTDSGRGLFASTVPNDYFIALCYDAFHHTVNVDTLKKGIKKTIRSFGASHFYNGTNSLIFHGELDPWKNLGVNSTKDSSSVYTLIKGVGHAAILQPPRNSDPYSLQFARRNVLTTSVKKWVTGSSKNQMTIQKEDLVEEEMDQQPHVPQLEPHFAVITNRTVEIEYGEHPSVHPFKDFKAFVEKAKAEEKESAKYINMRPAGFADTFKMYKMRRNIESNATNHIQKKYLKTGYAIQFIDQFKPNYRFRYAQRFFVNDQFQRDRNATRFLMMGGEDAINYAYVDGDTFEYYQWAKDFRAVMYALEHRFWGYSQPFGALTVQALQYLRHDQVLADTAVFVWSMNKKENLTNPRWIVFGGSYPGNLAAMFRVRYPSLSVGAVASSAPLQARTDFFEYMQRVETDVKLYGKEGCSGAARRFFGWIRRKMNSVNGRIQVKAAFCVSNDWHENYIDEKDADFFITSKIFSLMSFLQYDWQDHYLLKYLCDYYKKFDDTHGAEKTSRLREFVQGLEKLVEERGLAGQFRGMNKLAGKSVKADDDDDANYSDGDDDTKSEKSSDSESGEHDVQCYCQYCYSVSYNRYLAYLQDVFNTYSGIRQWYWLVCTQWGYSESTNYGYNIFESGLPVNHGLDICTDIFGEEFNRTAVEAGVRHTNYLYGGSENYNGTNVALVNGSEDPWSAMGVYKPLQKSAVVIYINGTSHCMDMYRAKKNDVKDLKKARKQIKKLMISWVKGANQ